MFRNKEYVLSVYREGSFTKASEKLFVSQPSLSASVKRIEEKILAPIFDRSNNPIQLTEVGREYVKYALEIESKEKEFERYIYDHENLLAGNIRIGGSSLFSSLVLPEMIAEFNKKFPKITFKIFEDSTKNLMKELANGNLDIIIDNAEINDDGIVSNVYTKERLLVAVPKGFEINQKLAQYKLTTDEIKDEKYNTSQSVSLKVFKDLPFILLNLENDTGKRAEKLLKKSGISPTILFLLDQQLTAFNITCSGMGISFVSDTLIKRIGRQTDVCYYLVSDDATKRNIYFYQKKNHYSSLACRKFIEFNTEKVRD